MRHNRVLNVAIATALSMGAVSTYAGVLETGYGDGTSVTWVGGSVTPPSFASEYFLSSPTIPSGARTEDFSGAAAMTTPMASLKDKFFYARYQLETTVSQNFLAKFDLSNGAQFGGANGITLGGTNGLDFRAGASSTTGGVPATFSTAFGPSGNKGDTQVTFLVQAASGETVQTDDHLLLRFQLQNADVLSTPGAKIDMTVSIFDTSGTIQIDNTASNHSPTATIVQSSRGAAIELKPATGTAEIDVGTGSINFTGSIISPTMVELGTLEIAPQTGVLKDIGADWTFGTDDPVPTAATLTITDGNFNASQSGGQVFLDLDKNNAYDSLVDIASTVDVDGTTATWNLTTDQLNGVRSVSGSIPIIIETDGTTEINEAKEAPLATFSVEYSSAGKDTVSSKLRQIKRNGTVCTLYNIPNPTAIDTGNIRITNTSAKDVKIRGTLRSLDGMDIFTNQILIENMVANETVRLTQTELDAKTKNEAWLTAWQADSRNPSGGESGWPGRAVLTISGDTSSMEVFGLVRNSAGGPLTNMSVGGTGNGCD